jgi:hypothetical protein
MAANPAETHAIRGLLRGRAIDRLIAALAERQLDLVGRAQLMAIGVSARAIELRVASGRLRRVLRGVYTVSRRPLSQDGWCMAAALYAGAGAVVSHRSAAALWGMLRGAPGRPEVTVPRERRQTRAVRFHSGRIASDEITVLRDIPVTSVSRTVLDLATVSTPARVASAMAEAEVRRLTDRLSLPDLLERYPGRPGVAVIKAILRDRQVGTSRTRSELEAVLLEFVDQIGLPRPEMNVWLNVGGRWIEADCVWRKHRLLAELDGQATHLTATAFVRDRARDRAVVAAGWRCIRITWRHFQHEPRALEADLRALLSS